MPRSRGYSCCSDAREAGTRADLGDVDVALTSGLAETAFVALLPSKTSKASQIGPTILGAHQKQAAGAACRRRPRHGVRGGSESRH